jgi:hypothetical protein
MPAEAVSNISDNGRKPLSLFLVRKWRDVIGNNMLTALK